MLAATPESAFGKSMRASIILFSSERSNRVGKRVTYPQISEMFSILAWSLWDHVQKALSFRDIQFLTISQTDENYMKFWMSHLKPGNGTHKTPFPSIYPSYKLTGLLIREAGSPTAICYINRGNTPFFLAVKLSLLSSIFSKQDQKEQNG